MTKKLFFLLGGLLFFLFSSTVSAGCAILSNSKLSAVREPLVQLLQVEDNDAQYGYVPLTAIKYIDQLKSALIALVNERIACENNLSINPKFVQQDLLSALRLSELKEAESIYGYDLQVLVDRPEDMPDIMIVQTSFGIPCGDDNILLVYRFRNNSWHLDLVWKSQPYKLITGAFSSYFDYLLLPSSHDEAPKLIVVHSVADCTASWQPLMFDVIKLADDKSQQTVLKHQQLITYRGKESVNLSKVKNGFELRANVAMLDSDLGSRSSFYHYSIDNNKVIREQPIAKTPRDFVDEWLTLTKEDVNRFSSKDNVEQLLQQQIILKDRGGFYGATKYCKQNELYEVEVTFNGSRELDTEILRYFYVKPINNGYLMYALANQPDKRCFETH